MTMAEHGIIINEVDKAAVKRCCREAAMEAPGLTNRFELCVVGSKRAKEIARGKVSNDVDPGEKPVVTAMREIAENKLSIPDYRNRIIEGLQNPKLRDMDIEEDLTPEPFEYGDEGKDRIE